MSTQILQKNGTKSVQSGLDTGLGVQCCHVQADFAKKKTPYYIPSYQPYTMTQVEITPHMNTPENLVIKYAPTVIRGIQMIALLMTIILMYSFVSAFPVSITIFFLALPALIMNIGWLMFSQAV